MIQKNLCLGFNLENFTNCLTSFIKKSTVLLKFINLDNIMDLSKVN